MLRKPANFNPLRLTQARNAKLLNMTQLAERVELTRQSISQYENGQIEPSPEKIRLLARELGVPDRFFYKKTMTVEQEKIGISNFRSMKKSTVKARRQTNVYLDWLTVLYGVLSPEVKFPPVKIPDFSISDHTKLIDGEIETFANKTREYFGIGLGPISDLTLLLENHGIIIGLASLQNSMDGVSAWFSERPFILVDSHSNAFRRRFDIAHELGHLILHRSIVQEDLDDKESFDLIEKQAHRFASAFLMPENTFSTEVYGMDFESLINLKKRWLASIAAIIMRLESTGLISQHQKRRLFQMLNMKNARRKEPLDNEYEPEQPQLFKKIIHLLSENAILNKSDFVDKTCLPMEFLTSCIAIPAKEFSTEISTDNVISLKQRR